MTMRPRPLFLILSLLSQLSFWDEAGAAKLDWSAGNFSMISQTPTTRGRVSGFGDFQISHRINFLRYTEFGYGYSLTFSKFPSGDYGYGPDMGFFIFPLGTSGKTRVNHPHHFYFSYDYLRPFVSVQFHARSFQSIGASYSGFSGGGGFEYWGYQPLGFRFWAKRSMLKGPQRSTATETTFYSGISWEY